MGRPREIFDSQATTHLVWHSFIKAEGLFVVNRKVIEDELPV